MSVSHLLSISRLLVMPRAYAYLSSSAIITGW